MKTTSLLLGLAMVTLLAVPAQADGNAIAFGHIQFGHAGTGVLTLGEATGDDAPDSFFFDVAGHVGENITTATDDHGGLGYDIDLYFWDDEGAYMGGCATPGADETCEVPPGATRGEVTAWWGMDLDVTVLLTE